jgi:hypothetical protein
MTKERRNRLLAAIAGVVLPVALLLLAVAEHAPPSNAFIVTALALGLLGALSHTRGFRLSGWAFFVLVSVFIYVPVSHPNEYSFHGVATAVAQHIQSNTEVIREDRDRFKDGYALLATASFTLYGFFFLATRRFDSIQNAVRLFALAETFGAVFIMSVLSVMFPQDGWWRISLVTLTGLGTLVALSRDPRPSIIDVSRDDAGQSTYWFSFLRNRRGQAYYALLGLYLLPAFPVLGEFLYFSGLLYLLFVAALASTFLYLSSELGRSRETDEQLQLLYRFKADQNLARRESPIPELTLERRSRVTTIPYTFPRRES